jgi:hypothetical protein
MASKLGEVLDIEAVDSYIKRLAGPIDALPSHGVKPT